MNETLRIARELLKYRLIKRKEKHRGKVINLFGDKNEESSEHGGSDAPKRNAGCS
ncbi:MAG: hypothetical protein JXA49_00280 [Actinobacteria bacterium]|nr:hypothetical protein [Actinomycetota bacterium]